MWLPVLVLGVALAGQQAAPFEIVTTHLPPPQAGQAYKAQLEASGGQAPYTWKIVQGTLPEGLRIDAAGLIAGKPTNSRPFSLLIEAGDAAHPPLVETRLIPTAATAPIELHWTQAPAVGASGENSGGEMSGAVQADYHGDEPAALTVFAVAVNENGKAFSLRYDHRRLRRGETTGALNFSVFLPPGQYRVQVDAVAEVRPGVIYRARLSEPGLDLH